MGSALKQKLMHEESVAFEVIWLLLRDEPSSRA